VDAAVDNLSMNAWEAGPAQLPIDWAFFEQNHRDNFFVAHNICAAICE
jgi:hypothetical protein